MVGERKNLKLLNPKLREWHTKDEMNFLKGLDGWRSFGCRTIDPEQRKILLRRYRDSMKAKVNWGTLDREQIYLAVRKQLEEVK